MRPKKILFILIAASLALKLVFFSVIASYAPQSKFQIDSPAYLQMAQILATHGVFAQHRQEDGTFDYELFRTPGYPFFLGIFHHGLHIPLNGIIVLQIFLTTLAAFFTYKTARMIDPRLALLSAIIILFDPPITAHSFILLTEPLFLFIISIFMYSFISYLKSNRLSTLILAGVFIAIAIYIRPVAYFLGIACSGFVLLTHFKINWTKALLSAMVLLFTVHTLTGIWQYRNYHRFRNPTFSTINHVTLDADGLWKSYARNKDVQTKNLPAPLYYANVTARCFISLMTRPGTFKYFGNDGLTVAGKTFGYPWMVFWLIGLIAGLSRIRKSPELQFMALMIVYFSVITIVATMWGANERFRVPMMPFIAILSAAGWNYLKSSNCSSFFRSFFIKRIAS